MINRNVKMKEEIKDGADRPLTAVDAFSPDVKSNEMAEESAMLEVHEFTHINEAHIRVPHQARKLTTILAVTAISFGAYIHGTTVAFPAVAIPSLKKSNMSEEDAPILPFHLSSDDISLIVSIAAFGMLFGCVTSGPIAQWVGRKLTAIIGVCGSLAGGYALIAGAQFVWMLLLGRFLHGVGLGCSITISTIYIAEIATPDMRGTMAIVPAVAGTLGMITCQILGSFLSWQDLSITFAFFNIPCLVFLLIIPETPVYLIINNKIDAAHKVLRILRGKNWDVTNELTNIKNASESVVKQRLTFRDFIGQPVIEPFLIALAMMFFFQFTGINIILQFTVEVFESAGSAVGGFTATIIVGLAFLICNFATMAIVDRLPRRALLLMSSFGISICNIGMGVQFFLKHLEQDSCSKTNLSLTLADSLNSTADCPNIYTENITWLPLLILLVYIFCFSLGFGPLIWMTVAELLPTHVRSTLLGLSVGFTCVMSFLTSHTFHDLKEAVNMEGVFWIYGGISLVGFLFVIFFVPETKGKTPVEIQAYFERTRRRNLDQLNETN